MGQNHDESTDAPVLALPRWGRIGLAGILVDLAVVHVLYPELAIDAVFLGLLAFAGLVWFFDFESIEWLGIRAQRRRIRAARAALQKAPKATAAIEPPAPPKPVPAPATTPATEPVTIHSRPEDLAPPVDLLSRLLWGTEQIRLELIVLLGSSGHLRRVAPWSDYSIPELVRVAVPTRLIPRELLDAALFIATMRNTIIHERVVNPASDFAMDLIQSLRSIPRTYVRVPRAHISLFRDRSLSTPYRDTAGVMLAHVKDDGTVGHVSVYPRDFEYYDGRFVSWLWNLERVFDHEAWYEDPVTRKPQMAFSESATFVGREFPQQWGLEFRLPRPDSGLIT